VKHRHDQLAEALGATGLRARDPREAIAELVPKRNIETWIYSLDEDLAVTMGEALNETDAFPKLEYESQCCRAAGRFAEHSRRGTKPEAAADVRSLLDGLSELARLPLRR
jgi:hypothetical protein